MSGRWLLLLAAGCGGNNILTVPGEPGPKEMPGPAELPAPKTVPGDTIPEDTAYTEPDLCVDLPTAPLSRTRIDGYAPSEEFAFDDEGNLLNLPDGEEAVFRTPFGAAPELLAPFDAIEVAGVRVTIDGGLAVANEWNGSVERVDLVTGARTLIAGGFNSPNSLAVGPDGWLYVGSFGEIARVQLETLELEPLLTLPGADVDGLTFSPDYRWLYFNSDENGLIGSLEIGPEGPAEQGELYAEVSSGFWSELDGMATDSCGNLFVARVDGVIFRVDTEGVVEEYVELDAWATALSFGSGIGGWQRDHLYVMDRGEGLIDVEVGVEGRPEPHLGE